MFLLFPTSIQRSEVLLYHGRNDSMLRRVEALFKSESWVLLLGNRIGPKCYWSLWLQVRYYFSLEFRHGTWAGLG